MENNLLINCMLCVGDIIGSDFAVSGSLIPVSYMEYTVFRSKNSGGKTVGHSVANMNLTLKLGEKYKARPLLELMKSTDPSPFTIMAHPVVENNRVTSFRNAMVVWGYITKAEESFVSDTADSWELNSGLLHIGLELNEIKYIGANSVRELHVFHG